VHVTEAGAPRNRSAGTRDHHPVLARAQPNAPEAMEGLRAIESVVAELATSS